MSDKTPIQALIAKYGITMSAEFVPLSRSRNAGTWESINWRVTVRRGRHSMTTDYSQGIGHLPKAFEADSFRTVYRDEKIRHALEHGTGPCALGKSKLKPPSIEDVLHALLLDSDAIDYVSFESWANEFGYDVDSRKAEHMYRDCLATGLKLRVMLGDAALIELREAFREY